jgi:hypothetical protein
MDQARIGFGAVVDPSGEKIYIAGGTLGKHKPTAKSEMYSLDEDRWINLPNLNEPRFSQTLCLFNEELLYSFGGFDEKQKGTTSVERLNVKTLKRDSKWTKLQVNLPQTLSNMGAF